MVTAFVCSVHALSAQTITQVFHEPVIGEVDKNYRLDTSAYSGGLPVSITGSNVVWDFSQLKGAFPVMFDSIIAPSSAPGASMFPNADFVQNRSGIYSFFRSASGPDRTELIGAFSPSLSVTFTNSAVIAGYPISYGYAMFDNVSGNFKYNNTTGACNGSIAVTADGIGTLVFPDNVSFQNVLRLRSVEELTMSVGLFPIGQITQHIYSYYAPGKKYPVLSVQYQKYELLAGSPTITAIAYANFDYFTVTALVEEQQGRGGELIFPNPFSDQFSLNETNTASGGDYFLYSLSGVLLSRGATAFELQREALPDGIYLLEKRNANGSVYQKIIKE